MVSIDLEKAFDTTDHRILIEKMKCMGFSNVTNWFECYLSKRMFSVNVGNSFSDKALINYGLPQGLFQAANCDLLLYVHVTGLVFQHKDINIRS